MKKNKSMMLYAVTYRENRYYRGARIAFSREEARKIIAELKAEGYGWIRVYDRVIYKEKDFEILNSYLASCGQ